MNRSLLAGLVAAAVALGAASSGGAARPLVVGTDPSSMPFEITHDGKVQGFDIDLWKDIAQDLKLDYKLQPMDFAGLIPALQTDNIDVALSGMTIKPERRKVIDFSIPYYASGLTALVPTSDTKIRSPADLDGKRIGVKTGTATVDWVKKNVKDARMVSFPNIDAQLSGGQQQRVAIARALAVRPKLMLFDEPTSALDPELRQEVLKIMQTLAEEGMTMVIVTHEIAFARKAGTRLVFMDAGRIVHDGKPDALLSQPPSVRLRDFLQHVA